jgi:hypothetical protein
VDGIKQVGFPDAIAPRQGYDPFCELN